MPSSQLAVAVQSCCMMSESSNRLGGMARLQSISISPGMSAAVGAPNGPAAAAPGAPALEGESGLVPFGVVVAGASELPKEGEDEEGRGGGIEEEGRGIEAG